MVFRNLDAEPVKIWDQEKYFEAPDFSFLNKKEKLKYGKNASYGQMGKQGVPLQWLQWLPPSRGWGNITK